MMTAAGTAENSAASARSDTQKTAAAASIEGKRTDFMVVFGGLHALRLYRRSKQPFLFIRQQKSSQAAEEVSRIAVPLSGGLFQPIDGGSAVGGHTKAVQIAAAQAELGIPVVAMGGGAVLFHILRDICHFFHTAALPECCRSTHIQPTCGGQTSNQQCGAAQSFPAGVLLSLHTWGKSYHDTAGFQADSPHRHSND